MAHVGMSSLEKASEQMRFMIKIILFISNTSLIISLFIRQLFEYN
jgi:hypothetical protein